MRQEQVGTGKTVEEAIENACKALGCDRDDCQWEIIDMPRKGGFLGLKTLPAKVKIWQEQPDPVPETVQPSSKPKPVSPAPAAQKAAPAQEAPQPQPEVPEEPKAEIASDVHEELQRECVTKGFTEKEKIVQAYLSSILRELGLEAELKLYRTESGIYVDIVGKGLGSMIGRRGEALDALQYLVGLAANRMEGDYIRVTLDCGDYREKRKETLEALAKKLAAQVLKTNVSKTLEPMNPFERRVIHATVSKIEGVTSSSIGAEPNRRVVITSPTAKRPSFRGGHGDNNRHGGRGGRSRSGGRDGRRDDRRHSGRDNHSQPPVRSEDSTPKETPESTMLGDAPMGKLDLE